MPTKANPLCTLNASGQSVWYDNIRRSMLTSGELATLVSSDDLRGMTSNPTIFEKAIAGGDEYDDAIQRELAVNPQLSSRELFLALAVADIRAAAGALRPAYEATGGVDGMVSLEVSPDLAYDTEATIREARELHKRLDRRNVMIKVPATKQGLPAIEALIADGININVTLLFSVDRYLEVADAYLRGLERRVEQGLSVDAIGSVASFFVSRVDTAIDPLLAERCPQLQGKIAIANAKLAYRRFNELVQGERFAALRAAGARPQRLLWASTSAKNPAYRDVLYVEELIGPHTVDTMPPATYEAFRDHGVVAPTLDRDVDEALTQLAALSDCGINLTEVTDRLEQEGVASFAKSFTTLLTAIESKAAKLSATA